MFIAVLSAMTTPGERDKIQMQLFKLNNHVIVY